MLAFAGCDPVFVCLFNTSGNLQCTRYQSLFYQIFKQKAATRLHSVLCLSQKGMVIIMKQTAVNGLLRIGSLVLALILIQITLPFSIANTMENNPNPSTNNVRDFNLDVNTAAPGQWYYFNGSPVLNEDNINGVGYLSKGLGGSSTFKDDEWALSLSRTDAVWLVKSNGVTVTDFNTMGWGYKLPREYVTAKGGVNISGNINTSLGAARLRIVHVFGTKEDIPTGRYEILLDTEESSKNFDFTIPQEKLSANNDIFFLISKPAVPEWWVVINTDFNIKAMNAPQIATPKFEPFGARIDSGALISLSTETVGADIYYTLDNSDPETSPTRRLFAEPFPVTEHTTIKMIAEKAGLESSYQNSKRYLVNYPINRLLGVSNGTVPIDNFSKIRFEEMWQWFQKEHKGPYDEEEIRRCDERVLQYVEKGYEYVMMFCFTAPWATIKGGYEHDEKITGNYYVYGPATNVNGQYVGQQQQYNRWGELTYEGEYTVWDKIAMNPDYSYEWVEWVQFMVSRYSQPPFNLRNFEIWNEAYPASGFYYGSLEQFFEVVYVPAAKGIKELNIPGVNVLFGGWACCGPMSQFEYLLDRFDAWQYTDNYNLHYMTLAGMDYMYRAAKKRGVEKPMVWQTEMGFSSAPWYPLNMYFRTLRWGLEHGFGSDNPEVVNLTWFANWSPNAPEAFGYNATVTHSDGLTTPGRILNEFSELLTASKLEEFNNFKTDPYLRPELYEMESSAEGFLLDDNKALVAFHLAKQSNYSNIFADTNGTGRVLNLSDPKVTFTLDVKGVKGNIKVTRTGLYGSRTPLTYTRIDEDTIRIKVPVLDEDPEEAKDNGIGSFLANFNVLVESDEAITHGNWTMPNYPKD